MTRHILIGLIALLPVQAAAGTIGSAEQVQACVLRQIDAAAPVADCVNEAQTECLDLAMKAPMASVACFRDARDTWTGYIGDRMAHISATAPGELAGVAGIEVKYDLLQNLMQCDRMIDLTLLREDPSEATEAQKARCEATATALAYVKLLLQSRNLN